MIRKEDLNKKKVNDIEARRRRIFNRYIKFHHLWLQHKIVKAYKEGKCRCKLEIQCDHWCEDYFHEYFSDWGYGVSSIYFYSTNTLDLYIHIREDD